MKITDVKPYAVWVGHRNQMLVKVETDSGIYGWGESGLSGREMAVKGAVEHYREWLIGRDPMKRGALWQEMYRSQYFEGGRVLTAAISAIDIALYDIAGKALGVPVYELLGGRHRDNVHTFATTRAKPGQEMIDQAKAIIDAGWNCMRLSSEGLGIGTTNEYEPRESIGRTAEWFVKTREALGNEPVLGVDYHHRLSVAEAASFLQMMPSHTLDFIEEPIRDESPEAYEALRKMTPVPFAIGEEFSSKWQFLPYIERGITNYARLDLCNVGGFSEAMKVAGWAEAHYIDLMPHNPLGPICTIATVHFAAAIPNFAWLETWRSPFAPDQHESEQIFKSDMEFSDARFIVPEAPGLGIEVNEDALSVPFKPWEAPHLHRRDGSYTNW
jgi:galactonate dehydratase